MFYNSFQRQDNCTDSSDTVSMVKDAEKSERRKSLHDNLTVPTDPRDLISAALFHYIASLAATPQQHAPQAVLHI